MDLPFIVATLTRRGLLTPGSPVRVARSSTRCARGGGAWQANYARQPPGTPAGPRSSTRTASS